MEEKERIAGELMLGPMSRISHGSSSVVLHSNDHPLARIVHSRVVRSALQPLTGSNGKMEALRSWFRLLFSTSFSTAASLDFETTRIANLKKLGFKEHVLLFRPSMQQTQQQTLQSRVLPTEDEDEQTRRSSACESARRIAEAFKRDSANREHSESLEFSCWISRNSYAITPQQGRARHQTDRSVISEEEFKSVVRSVPRLLFDTAKSLDRVVKLSPPPPPPSPSPSSSMNRREPVLGTEREKGQMDEPELGAWMESMKQLFVVSQADLKNWCSKEEWADIRSSLPSFPLWTIQQWRNFLTQSEPLRLSPQLHPVDHPQFPLEEVDQSLRKHMFASLLWEKAHSPWFISRFASISSSSSSSPSNAASNALVSSLLVLPPSLGVSIELPVPPRPAEKRADLLYEQPRNEDESARPPPPPPPKPIPPVLARPSTSSSVRNPPSAPTTAKSAVRMQIPVRAAPKPVKSSSADDARNSALDEMNDLLGKAGMRNLRPAVRKGAPDRDPLRQRSPHRISPQVDQYRNAIRQNIATRIFGSGSSSSSSSRSGEPD
eukprot:ANDGO_07715.mRNA.1 hypothetical protein